ncbi:N-acetylmuramic acid 6-phosphate etherase [Rubellimicrobium roseum]|uniref:N-acetylmuramic acid 6-phosphate etherase n=1 Tax=Rubellimicrobium roseum TaxID=687525 RepID=A0A5C4NEV0_9RHOB|nr:N-acetylmuramic acid 6-phosphate etherase [Rubellimicrobium roseum]TNC73294.1 N-acetylmuramic acid 6-phosphate etherase [Rubellimicrobium roseum]
MTEAVDPRTQDLDGWTPLEAATAIWEGQLAAVAAVGPALPAIAEAVERAAGRLGRGGRLAYAGAGTSARIAVQDGSELAPTFDWPEDRVLFLIAGGPAALLRAAEGAEDDRADAQRQVEAARLGPADVLIGLAASGRTPFTASALEAASAAGALTIGLANNPDAPLLAACDVAVLVETGPEPVAGSTRMKAGTAQKVVLNTISTLVMVRLGRVHQGLMVEMRPGNDKLRARAVAMVAQIAGCPSEEAKAALDRAGWSVKAAVLVARGLSPEEAARRLAIAGGRLRAALGP